MIDRRPGVIVRCDGVDDVVAAVNLARQDGLAIAVRGGPTASPVRHSGPRCRDRPRRHAGGRGRWDEEDRARRGRRDRGAFNDAMHEHGLATTGGIISTTGVGELTLGGGIGYLSREHGLSCDNLRAAEVVTADGRILAATENENEDLFWALRGGGGNFGVVTAFEYDLHPVREVYGGPILFELRDAADVLRFYREFIRDAPEEFGGFPAWQIAPPLPFIPEGRQGEPVEALPPAGGQPSAFTEMIDTAQRLVDHLRGTACRSEGKHAAMQRDQPIPAASSGRRREGQPPCRSWERVRIPCCSVARR